MTIQQIHTSITSSITDLKRDPMGLIEKTAKQGGAIAILNRNQPVFYCITPELFAYYQALHKQANE